MKRKFESIILFFLLSFAGVYQSFGNDTEEKSLLWKISGNGLESPSYLFGTIHVICEDNFLMNGQIEAALKESHQLALEIDVSDPEMIAKIQMLSLNEGMRNIKEDLNSEQIDAVNEYFTEKFGAGIDQFGILKPFVISSLLIQGSLPCSSAVSYETFFSEAMKAENKTLIGLETIEFQMSIFDKIPQKFQLEEIVKSITEKDMTEQFIQLMNAYTNQDIEKMYGLGMDSALFQEYADLILVERNKNWISKIEEMIKQAPTFVAVGAAHLPSETGVIQLLIDQGYTVEPIIF